MSNRLTFSDAIRIERPSLRRDPWLPTWNAVRKAWRRYRTRQRIADLDGYMLKDIGVSYADAENEANKPFWRA